MGPLPGEDGADQRQGVKNSPQSRGELSPQQKRVLLKRLLRDKARRPKEAPLSFGQERLWFLDQLAPANAAYCETVSGRLTARGSARLLNQALNEIVRRHEILRTTFGAVDGRPVQRIAAELRLETPVVDLSELSEETRARELRMAVTTQARHPFDLSRGPLLRLTLVRLHADDHAMVLTFHHIVGDAWSVGVLLQELFVTYRALAGGSPCPLPPPAIQYSDFARWQRKQLEGEHLASGLAHLRERLKNLTVLELPADRPRRAVQSFRGASYTFELRGNLLLALEGRAREEGATLFMILLMAFQALLSRYTDNDDIVVGSPVAGRNRPEFAGLIGFFANLVLLRTNLRGDPIVRELLRRVRGSCLDAYAHQDVPFQRLVEELQPDRSLGRESLFQVAFAHYKDLLEAPNLAGVDYEPVPIETGTSKFDLFLYTWKAQRDQSLSACLEYSTDLFDASTIVRLTKHFQMLLQGIAIDLEQRLSELSLLGYEERQQVLLEWSSEHREFAARSVLDAIELLSMQAPDAVAVVFAGEHLTRRELNRRSDQLARYLRSRGIGPDMRVGLFMERSLSMVVGLLGIWKSGGAYVPLDPSYPEERISFILTDTRAKFVVTHSAVAKRVPVAAAEQIALDDDRWPFGEESAGSLAPGTTDANLAYVIYTSGSTGRPKGVAVTRANVARLLEATEERFDFDDSDVWTLFHSYGFDFSVWELWGALLYGGRLVVVPQGVSRSPEELRELLSRERVTVLNQTPSAFGPLQKAELEAVGSVPLALRLVIFGGEALDLKSLESWFGRHGDAHPRLVNMYGITETTVHVTVRPLAARDLTGSAAGVIGRSLPDLQLYILDRRGQPVPIGVPGEIHVGGAGLVRGYLDRPELTAARFIPDPFGSAAGERLYRTGDRARWLAGGELQYLGRIDHQVKIRGFRIELGEIESVLREHSSVREAVVVMVGDEPVKRLAAYVVVELPGAGGKGQPTLSKLVSELRKFVAARLPGYMVPASFVTLDKLPLNANGKVDRKALPAPGDARPELGEAFVAPGTALERELAAMWSEVLGTEPIGVHDDFFELGGHSLLATQLVSRVREAFRLELPLAQLFEKPTIAAMAHALSSGALPKRVANRTELRRDVILDPTISVVRPVGHVESPNNVLLTGSTGFLGAFLLHELLARTNANVYCLVRAASTDEARKRIEATLGGLSLEQYRSRSRIVPVPGDLSRPLLGLSAAQFDALASRLDLIYHNGAMVNAIYPYSVHKPSNVVGTHEVLRLASRIRVKPVHYVSTTGVVAPPIETSSDVILEEADLDQSGMPVDGYSQSKWVAEQVVREARTRGLPVCIYRPGRISGHSHNGVSNDGDLFSIILKTCIELGQVPELETSAMTDLVPVDYVSRALVHLSLQEESLGRVFHLVHPRPVAWSKLMEWIVEFGYPLRQVPLARWFAERNRLLGQSPGGLSAAFDVFSVEQVSGILRQEQRFDCRHTLEGLEGSSIVCPAIDEKLLTTYFSYWIESGHLHAPLVPSQQDDGRGRPQAHRE
jgi:amino acid adenylation domain-containing protein/thioester reductase-like protein